jgi:predicted amidohydrolase YtcJ
VLSANRPSTFTTTLHVGGRSLSLAIAALCALSSIATAHAPPEAADLALRNGAVYTLDGARSWAQAVAIRAGRIAYVGTDAGLASHVGGRTRVVDLHGRMLLPGFQGAHIHPISGGIQANSCDLSGVKSVEEYVQAVRQYAAAHPEEAWITGGGWLMSTFGPGGRARRELLDAVVPNRPVYLASSDGHTVWVNTRALELAHITADTPDPPDGRIDRDPQSHQPLGTLQEGASAPVDAVLPQPTSAQRIAGLEYALRLLNGYGITAMQDAAVYEEDLKTYRALERRGALSVHVVAALWWEHTEGLEQIERFERLRRQYRSALVDPGTVKIMQDGVMENYTAVLLQPYHLPGEVRGIPMVEPGLLREAVTRLDAAGFQVHFHTIGDGAVREALDAIAAARAHNGDLGHRHHLAHLELIDPADVPRFRELGAAANFQPLWAFADDYVTQLTIPFLGPERSGRLYPIGSVYRSGAVVAFGSDWSVSSANPLEEIQVAVTRMDPAGGTTEPLVPQERIALPEALAAFTINAAWVNRLEKETGSIEVGKRADLVVLDRNLFAIPVTEIAHTRALVTLFGGRVVHGDLAAL